MNKYLLSDSLLKQIKRDHQTTKNISRNPKNPATYGVPRSERFLAEITGYYTEGTPYPEEGSYIAKQIISDSNGEIIDSDEGFIWGDGDSESFPPIVDIGTLDAYHTADDGYQRIQIGTIVEVWSRGNLDGDTFWYCSPPNPITPISFSAEYFYESSLDKIRINNGNVYGRGFTTNVPEQKFEITADLYIYLEYTITLATYEVSGITLDSSTGRPTEIIDDSVYRTVAIPLCSFDSSLRITRYWEGDISVHDIYGHWYDGTNSPLSMTYSGEHTESLIVDSGWLRNKQNSYSGITITIQTGMAYNESGLQQLLGYYRDITYDQEGKIKAISAERRVVIDSPESC